MLKEFRIESKVKNNLLFQRIMVEYDSVAEFCRKKKLSQTNVGLFLNLQLTVIDKRGKVRQRAIDLADALGCMPKDIFPASQWEVALKTNKVHQEVSAEDAFGFIAHEQEMEQLTYSPNENMEEGLKDAMESALTTLDPREQELLSRYYGMEGEGEVSFSELGKGMRSDGGDLSGTRIRQIVERAVRKMKQPSRSRKLREYINQ